MTRYIRNLQIVHPNATIYTNHHMAMHIHTFMLLFGPVHSWWTFPFERLIGHLQRLSTNDKPGKFYSNSFMN